MKYRQWLEGIPPNDESELDALLNQIPDDYEPEEIDFGGPVGNEVW